MNHPVEVIIDNIRLMIEVIEYTTTIARTIKRKNKIKKIYG